MVGTLVEHGAGSSCFKETGLGELVFIESLRYALDRYTCNQEVLECLPAKTLYLLMSHWSELLTQTLFLSHDRGYHSIEGLLLRRMELSCTASKAQRFQPPPRVSTTFLWLRVDADHGQW